MRPAAGVECAVCRREKQHRCQAQIYVDGEPQCLPCADGLPCCVDRVGAPPDPGALAEFESATMYAADITAAPAIHRTPEELGIDRVVLANPQWREIVPTPVLDAGVRKVVEEWRQRKEAARLHRDVEKRQKQASRMRLSVRVVAGKLDVKVIGGEEVAMSPKAVMGPEMLAPGRPPQRYVGSKPGRKLKFQAEELEKRREDITARNVAKGEATRARAGELLGIAPDPVIAERIGVSPSRVAQLRWEQGIAPVVTKNSHPGEMRTEEVMDEMREAVRKLGGTMTDAALGKQLGVSGSRVGQLRKELGIEATKPGAKRAQKDAPSKALIHAGQRAVTIPETGTIDALLEQTEGVHVHLRLTPAQARAQLAKLSPEQMEIALGAVMQSSLQEG